MSLFAKCIHWTTLHFLSNYIDYLNKCNYFENTKTVNALWNTNPKEAFNLDDLIGQLNLLAETSGLPESFRILTLFDKKFQSLWKPQNLRFEEYETILAGQKFKSHSIVVRCQFQQKTIDWLFQKARPI